MKKYVVIVTEKKEITIEADRAEFAGGVLYFYREKATVAIFREWLGYFELS